MNTHSIKHSLAHWSGTRTAARVLLASAALLLDAGARAGTCDLARDANGYLHGTCELSYFFPTSLQSFLFLPLETPFKPNLVPDRLHFTYNRGVVDVALEVDNTGQTTARAPTAYVVIQVWRGGSWQHDHLFLPRFRDITPGGSGRVFLGQIPLADVTIDNDLYAMIAVDPTSAVAPTGAIKEQVETDNTATSMCRIYGSGTYDPRVAACN